MEVRWPQAFVVHWVRHYYTTRQYGKDAGWRGRLGRELLERVVS